MPRAFWNGAIGRLSGFDWFGLDFVLGGALGGEFALGQSFGGDAQVLLQRDGGVTLAVGGLQAALAIARQLTAATGGSIGAVDLGDLQDLDGFGSDRVVGSALARFRFWNRARVGKTARAWFSSIESKEESRRKSVIWSGSTLRRWGWVTGHGH